MRSGSVKRTVRGRDGDAGCGSKYCPACAGSTAPTLALRPWPPTRSASSVTRCSSSGPNEITDIDGAIARLADDMFATIYDAHGAGLAAPQVGVQKRLFVYDIDDDPVGRSSTR